ncbi:MAG: UMP kinase [Elusimicrobia bacterium]|nr:UMP kinase [Candidatus Obscuribacterium magneticum]
MERVVLKLSGEALLGGERYGIDLKSLFRMARDIKAACSRKVQLAIVIGGGNIWRGARDQGLALERAISDNMGMLATLINAIALQNALEQVGVPTRVMSAINVSQVAEPYIRRRAIRHLEKGRVIVFAAGTGNPYFTTDTAAALRASEIGATLLLKATQVDGVYSADPKKSRNVKLFKRLSLEVALRRRLGIMDQTALALCQENNLSIRVFNLHKPRALTRAIQGQSIGTLVTP